MNKRHLTATLALTLSLLTSSAFAESLWVKSAKVDIHSGKGAVYPVTGTAVKGTEVTVVSKDAGWVQVTSGAVTGWVFENSLSATKVGADNSLGGADAQMSTAAAARGLAPDAEAYVSTRRLDKSSLERLIALRKTIAPQEWEKFQTDVHK
jgi:uncharacterized protein YraI